MKKTPDPYRLFFPLGLVLGIFGTALWIFFGLHVSHAYPGTIHANVMIGGFLFSFAAGFLMTAIPRFTGTAGCSFRELSAAFVLLVSLAISGALEAWGIFHFLLLLLLGFVAFFGGRRLRARSYDPPSSFIFVGVGLICGIGGAALSWLGDLGFAWPRVLAMGRTLYLHGMMLSLVLGVGSRLIPAFLGWRDFPVVSLSGNFGARKKNPWIRKPGVGMALLAALFLASFGIETFWDSGLGRGLRALVVTGIAFSVWKIPRLPRDRTRLSVFLWIACWFLVAGLWGGILFPAYQIHWLHLSFIGGFGVMTLMIATRVTLSHGHHDTELETRSKAILISQVLILVAAVTRAMALLTPSTYEHHLIYAASCWIGGLLVWGFVFVPKMFSTGTVN